MTKYEIHKSITKTILSPETCIEDVLLYMVLLHTHDIYLRPGVVLEDVQEQDATNSLLVPAITRRHAAEVVASLWPPESNKGNAEYWHSFYNKRTPYEVLSNVPTDGRMRLLELRDLLLQEPRIESVVEA